MRLYRQFCGVARALDIVGERWTLLLVRNLIPGGQRYSDLLEGLPGITTNLLAKRLKHLTEHGVIEQQHLPPPAASTVYALTALGHELVPAVLALGAFGARFMDTPHTDDHTHPRWAMVSLRRRFRPSSATYAVQFQIEGQPPYWATFGPDGIDVRDGTGDADAVMVASPRAFGAWLMGRDIRALHASNALRVDGDIEAFAALGRAIQPL